MSETPKIKNWLFLFLSIFCCAISFPRHWVLNVESLPGGREVGRRFCRAWEPWLQSQNIFLLHCCYYIHPPYSFKPMGLSWRLICFNVGAFENDSVLTCCWQSKKKKKIKEVESEAKEKIRYNSWSIKCWFNVALNATLAAFGFSVSQRLCHFSWSVFLFPCP